MTPEEKAKVHELLKNFDSNQFELLSTEEKDGWIAVGVRPKADPDAPIMALAVPIRKPGEPDRLIRPVQLIIHKPEK
jgi:hypothetical protein